MTSKPILFNSEMVKAILDGRKTQTRRIVKPQVNAKWSPVVVNGHGGWFDEHGYPVYCPYGQVGGELWVRETFSVPMASWTDYGWEWDEDDGRRLGKEKPNENQNFKYQVAYRASYGGDEEYAKWRPSIFMPKWASRITLKITDIHIEHLQDISGEDARAEGVAETSINYRDYELPEDVMHGVPADYSFKTLWDSINAKRGYSWESNPYVWVVKFEVKK